MNRENLFTSLLIACALCGCKSAAPQVDAGQVDKAAQVDSGQVVGATVASGLADARREFTTRIIKTGDLELAVPAPPPGVFNLIRYKSPVGELAAYVTPAPGDRAKHPAIVWITGGDCNSISEMWSEQPRANDQSAAAYRRLESSRCFPRSVAATITRVGAKGSMARSTT